MPRGITGGTSIIDAYHLIPLLIFIIAGAINASFVVPVRYIKHLSLDAIWFYHSLIGLIFIPIFTILYAICYDLFSYRLLVLENLDVLLIGGGLFGIGQVCFATALRKIPIALCFSVNLSIGVVLGTVYVLAKNSLFFSEQGLYVVLSLACIVIALTLYYFAHKHDMTTQQHQQYRVGWFLAVFAGICSGCQNISFMMMAFDDTVSSASSFWVWPPFLIVSGVIMALGFARRLYATQLRKNYLTEVKDFLLIAMMGALFFGSLIVYGVGMDKLAMNLHALGWPSFMIAIIAMSYFWSWRFGEFFVATRYRVLMQMGSVFMLIVALVLLVSVV